MGKKKLQDLMKYIEIQNLDIHFIQKVLPKVKIVRNSPGSIQDMYNN